MKTVGVYREIIFHGSPPVLQMLVQRRESPVAHRWIERSVTKDVSEGGMRLVIVPRRPAPLLAVRVGHGHILDRGSTKALTQVRKYR
jgi:hypothetical protein